MDQVLEVGQVSVHQEFLDLDQILQADQLPGHQAVQVQDRVSNGVQEDQVWEFLVLQDHQAPQRHPVNHQA